MLQSLSQLLHDTPGAVGSFNVVDFGMAQAVIAAAEESGRPAVIGVATRHWHLIDALRLAPSLLALAKAAAVPIALHLDHAGPGELDIIRAALDAGFTSIMIDASKLSFEDNGSVTLEVCRLAADYGASVEAELGAISGEEGVAGLVDPDFDESMFTDPGKAEEFVERCPVDALAVSIGTAHGLYRAQPKLQFELISELARRIPVPLAMHGATGVSHEAIAESVRRGIRKINYFSGFLVTAMDEVRDSSRDDSTDFVAFRQRLVERWKREALEQIVLYQGSG